jgi:hypothetical protein
MFPTFVSTGPSPPFEPGGLLILVGTYKATGLTATVGNSLDAGQMQLWLRNSLSTAAFLELWWANDPL